MSRVRPTVLRAWILVGMILGGAAAAHGRAQTPGAETPKASSVTWQVAVTWQAALDRTGFSPGIIDGIVGPKTRTGLRAFQAHAGLPVTGRMDRATFDALEIAAEPAVQQTELTQSDAEQLGPCPRDWVARSRLEWLGYDSLAALAAERGHCTLKLLARLNPGVDLDELKPGDELWLPNVARPRSLPRASAIEVDFGAKLLRILDTAGNAIALLHCSIAKNREKRPHGECRIDTIAMNPPYLFDPINWPEVENVNRRLVIPPGPRNPVGLCWIGLSVTGYGIHGTPEPKLIGKTGSHGCFRLTNWDVLRLAGMVRVGTAVRWVDSAADPVLEE